jgi:hypothetical protein
MDQDNIEQIVSDVLIVPKLEEQDISLNLENEINNSDFEENSEEYKSQGSFST